MAYVDGFVLAVPNDKKDAYRRHAIKTAPMLKEHGALSMVECWGDDVPEGKLTSFPMAVKCEADETVVFSWMTWPSKGIAVSFMRGSAITAVHAASRTWRDGQAIQPKATVSCGSHFTAIGNEVSLPSGTSSPQQSTTTSAPCSLNTAPICWQWRW